ncbi:hypothetical protein LX99_00608 [Mucilaginibacter oryzae]|uniref:Urease accessory protein UreH-like transmembrane domain-containing protein n=1 Tax=Mucilaginibacter oryzae TaxID=468058 RepID=A0A316HFZ8_9SPHI|nr:sulfite exporter TauE/SafE family protein [Mucilaginibacter oryzae]PWK80144.1 hypothetical protein LX99_00608 [Mucilaginibacter oryzae]
MSTAAIAFFIGLFGSVHCIGMCGPLAFSIPSFHAQWWRVVLDKVIYNLGRLFSYTLLGFLTGLLGRQLWLLGLQQGVSIISGLLIMGAGLSRILKIRFTQSRRLAPLLQPLNKLIVYALKQRAGHLIVGILNGFLPCGFVYIALVGAVNTGTPAASAVYMFWFGAGTFPLMLAATVSSGFVGPALRRRINKGIPYLMVCLGVWFTLRGLALNIPYLSPAKQESSIQVCH